MAEMFKFAITMPGQETYVRAIQRFASDIADWKPFWDNYFRDAWFRHIEAHYATQGKSTGEQWLPLSEAYGAWKQKHWPGLPIGVLSGATRESLTFPNDPMGIWEASNDGLNVGTRVPYAIYLQYGTRSATGGSVLDRHAAKARSTIHVRKGGMPARPPLRVTPNFVTLVAKLMQEYSVAKLRASGAADAAGSR